MKAFGFGERSPDDGTVRSLRTKLKSAFSGFDVVLPAADFEAVYREAGTRLFRADRARRRRTGRLLAAAAVFVLFLVPFTGIAAGRSVRSHLMAETEVRLLLDGVFDRSLVPGVEYARLLVVSYPEP